MLNEILEFEAYVKSPESEKPRIQPKLLLEKKEKNNSCKTICRNYER